MCFALNRDRSNWARRGGANVYSCAGPVQVFGRRHRERRLALRRPASKKRQGAVGTRLGSERYGDFRLAPSLLVGATLGRRDLHGRTQGRPRG
jgi:hypothetical protein